MQLIVCPISNDKRNKIKAERKKRYSEIRKQFNGGQW